VYKGEKYIQSFLENIVEQTIFDQCELIIINANSPESEEPIILAFQKKYPNIIYKRLEEDPGLYAVWNYAITHARGKYITNANVDDRVAPHCYRTYLDVLEKRPEVDLVYSDFYLTRTFPNYTFLQFPSAKLGGLFPVHEFSFARLKKQCFIGPQPMWRKSLHERVGLFNPSYQIAGDWEMWLRAASGGSEFVKIAQPLGIYYENPTGLSVGREKEKKKRLRFENLLIKNSYGSRRRYTAPHHERKATENPAGLKRGFLLSVV
jgi:glycosyltransferase involved in cell wall biosynthesis